MPIQLVIPVLLHLLRLDKELDKNFNKIILCMLSNFVIRSKGYKQDRTSSMSSRGKDIIELVKPRKVIGQVQKLNIDA